MNMANSQKQNINKKKQVTKEYIEDAFIKFQINKI